MAALAKSVGGTPSDSPRSGERGYEAAMTGAVVVGSLAALIFAAVTFVRTKSSD